MSKGYTAIESGGTERSQIIQQLNTALNQGANQEIRLPKESVESLPAELRVLLGTGREFEVTIVKRLKKSTGDANPPALAEEQIGDRQDVPPDSRDHKSGVIIGDRFIEASLPSGLRDGEKIRVEAKSCGNCLSLIVLKERESGESSSAASLPKENDDQAFAEAEKAIKLLLRSAGIKSFDPGTFRESLLGKLEKLNVNKELIGAVDQAISENNLGDPKALSEFLERTTTKVYLRIINGAISAKEQGTSDTVSSEKGVERVEMELEALLDQPALMAKKTVAAEQARSVENKKLDGIIRLRAQRALSGVEALAHLLNEFHVDDANPSTISGQWEEKELLKALNAQLQFREVAANRLKAILLSISRESMAETLMRTLRQVDADLSSSKKEIDERFLRFANELRERVDSWFKSPRDPKDLTPILKAALRTIEKEFPLTAPQGAAVLSKARESGTCSHIEAPPATTPKLSEPLTKALRAIEGQIRLILSAPSSAINPPPDEAVRKLIVLLKGVEEEVGSDRSILSTETDRKFTEFVSSLRKSLEQLLSKKLRDTLSPNSEKGGVQSELAHKDILTQTLLQALRSFEENFSDLLSTPLNNFGSAIANAVKGQAGIRRDGPSSAAVTPSLELPDAGIPKNDENGAAAEFSPTQKKALRVIQGYARLILSSNEEVGALIYVKELKDLVESFHFVQSETLQKHRVHGHTELAKFLTGLTQALSDFDLAGTKTPQQEYKKLQTFLMENLATIEQHLEFEVPSEPALLTQVKATIKLLQVAGRELGVTTEEKSPSERNDSSVKSFDEAKKGRAFQSDNREVRRDSSRSVPSEKKDLDGTLGNAEPAFEVPPSLSHLAGYLDIQQKELAVNLALSGRQAASRILLKDQAVRTVLALLGKLDWGDVEEKPRQEEQDFLSFIKAMQKELAREDKPKESISKEDARKAFAKIKDTFFNLGRVEHQKGKGEAMEPKPVLNNLEQVLRGQEFLQQINPVMQALGEPALLMFPAIFQNLLSKIELAVYPKQKGQQNLEENGEEESNGRNFERFQMLFPLPALGEVKVDFAIRPGEIYLNFFLEETGKALFLQKNFGRLERILAAAGFRKTEIQSRVEQNLSVEPTWVKEFAHAKSLIA